MKKNYIASTKDKNYKLKMEILLEETERLSVKGLEHVYCQSNSVATINLRQMTERNKYIEEELARKK